MPDKTTKRFVYTFYEEIGAGNYGKVYKVMEDKSK